MILVMSEAAKRLLEEAMNLPPKDRLTLAEQLVTSVVQAEPSAWEQAWLEELDLRLARARQSPEPAMTWDDVQQRLRSLAPR